jgi:uncharacterized membrane protein
MNKYITLAILTLIYAFLSSCTKRQAEMVPDEVVTPVPGNPSSAVTYANFVQPLFQSKCASCHASGASAAGMWTFNGHASVVSKATAIKQMVLVSKTMPKGNSLSPTELASLQTWFDGGLPQ